jgi:hypothetical protein
MTREAEATETFASRATVAIVGTVSGSSWVESGSGTFGAGYL